jgi:hypothetical protein
MLRGLLAQRSSEGRTGREAMAETLLQLTDDGLSPARDHFVQLASRILLGDPQAVPEPPELLSTLRSLGPRGPLNGLALRVASAAKTAFDTCREALQLRLTVCTLDKGERGDERLLLSIYSPKLQADVRVDDTVAAGVLVALQGEPDGVLCRLEVTPRMYRKICQNGLIVFQGDAPAHELDLQRLLRSEAPEPLAHALEHTIRACFDVKVFESAVNSCRRSANEAIADRSHAESLVSSLSPGVRRDVLYRFSAEGDLTRWGLLNAVTAEARTAPSGLLLDLERLGGKLARQSVATSTYVPEWPEATSTHVAGKPSLPSAKSRTAA